jgi:hypothetical protein
MVSMAARHDSPVIIISQPSKRTRKNWPTRLDRIVIEWLKEGDNFSRLFARGARANQHVARLVEHLKVTEKEDFEPDQIKRHMTVLRDKWKRI